jgi:phospholipid/cholesterol/gamma-HCH transport system ATP-binding protein
MIEVKNLNKSFGKRQILFDIDAKFETGKVNLIIGQSGQGKSVLTKCIVGLNEPETGEILFDDRDFSAMDRIERKDLRQEVGMLFQGAALFDFMNVEDNIRFPLKMFSKLSKKDIQKRVDFFL